MASPGERAGPPAQFADFCDCVRCESKVKPHPAPAKKTSGARNCTVSLPDTSPGRNGKPPHGLLNALAEATQVVTDLREAVREARRATWAAESVQPTVGTEAVES